MIANPRVLPLAAVKIGVGRRFAIAADPQKGAEGVEGVEPPVKPEGELVQVGLQVLQADPVVSTVDPGFQV